MMLLRQKSIRNCLAIFRKQKMEILRSKKNLLLFFVFPVALMVMCTLDDNAVESLLLFTIMGDIMPPMISIASQVAEEREKGIIRGLIYIGVNSFEYLAGMMMCTAMFSFICSCLMCSVIENKLDIAISLEIMLIHLVAIMCSMVIGAIIGVLAKNQVAVSAMVVPISICILFLSMLGVSKEKVHIVSQYFYSQTTLDVMIKNSVDKKDILIFLMNIFILTVMFVLFYKRRRNEE